jgi:2-(1,2-epoxy-1,2-dihydrophenyl)acetyl-CoA isomerase
VSITTNRDGDVAEIVLDRPDVLNSLDAATVRTLHDALETVGDARAVVVRGEGRGFSAGRDLSGAQPLEEDAHAILAEVFNPLIQRVRDLPVPTFAAVHGPCLGVGFGIAMACDVVYAARSAKLGSPFANIGCVLDSGGHAALVQRVGPHRALELIYTARLLSGDEAAAMGLVNAAVDDDELLATVRGLAARVAAGPTATFARSKHLVQRLADGAVPFAEVLEAEAVAQGETAGTPDYVEGITAFLEKRKPAFTGR